MQFNTIKQDRKPRTFYKINCIPAARQRKETQLNRQAGQKHIATFRHFSDQHRTSQGGMAFFHKASSPATALYGGKKTKQNKKHTRKPPIK